MEESILNFLGAELGNSRLVVIVIPPNTGSPLNPEGHRKRIIVGGYRVLI